MTYTVILTYLEVEANSAQEAIDNVRENNPPIAEIQVYEEEQEEIN